VHKGNSILFYRVALDIGENNGLLNKRFLTCVRFVADVATPAVFYVNAEWSKQTVLQTLGWSAGNLSTTQKRILEELNMAPGNPKSLEMPTLAYLVEGSWEKPVDPDTSARSGLMFPKREFVLSNSEIVHKAHLRDTGLNAQTAVLCLAAVGLEVMLPNVSFSLVADEEIERIKDELTEERHNYLEVVGGFAQEAYERLKAGEYSDVLRWAESEAAFKLVPKARMIEVAASSLADRQLRRAGYSFWKEGVPAIGSAYLSGGLFSAGAAAAQAALKAIVDSLDASRSERLLPEIAYAMKISKALSTDGNR
jgi:hypothetical protein